MKIKIEPSRGQGTLILPPSKSLFHRALLCAALAEGESKIFGDPAGEDLAATLRAIRALGADAKIEKNFVRVRGVDPFQRPAAGFDCASSGTTLRLSLPLFLLSGEPVEIVESKQLAARPMRVFRESLCKKGVFLEQNGEKFLAKGRLLPEEYTLDGSVSSQFVSGLLLALPLLDGDSKINLTAPLESRPYTALTRQVQAAFSVKTEETQAGFLIPGGQRYRPTEFSVEGDATVASLFAALNFFGSNIDCQGLSESTLQGDAAFPKILEKLDMGQTVDLTDTPDLAPLCFVVAALMGKGHFVGTKRLSYKESDRVMSMRKELAKCGARFEIAENEVSVFAEDLHAPKEILFLHDDHRVAMALAILLTRLGGTIDGAECVSKSYPDFWRALASLHFSIAEQ
ncbi:MAG: 3-phosphoshikimate 1-carboxyvinyltransferase [Clostridia bacterium]|nr:3-phosphoshikimate 1-carboxyvinyltransferase [Clostridia bacterium]